MRLYCMSNHRTAEQLAEMQRLEAAGICLFCPGSPRDDVRQREVVWESRHWTVLPNDFPYQGTMLHLLVVPHKHVNDMLDLDAESLSDFWDVLTVIRERFNLGHYGLGVRNGDCSFTGATIAHVHAHILVGDPTSEPEVPVRMKFSSRPPS
jgi:ATP adenylyltransferase